MRSLLIRILVLGHWAAFSCQPRFLSSSFVNAGGWEEYEEGWVREVYKEAESLVCLDSSIYKLRDVRQVDLSFPLCKMEGDVYCIEEHIDEKYQYFNDGCWRVGMAGGG